MNRVHSVASALAIAATALVGCAHEPARSTATASPTHATAGVSRAPGVMEQQAPNPRSEPLNEPAAAEPTPDLPGPPVSSPPGSEIGVRPNGTTVVTGVIPVPPGSSLTSSAAVSEVRSFPEEIDQTSGAGPTGQETLKVRGMDRLYQSDLTYEDAVDFFDHQLPRKGCQINHHVTSKTSTVWAVRAPSGQAAHIAVRDTRPVTFEIVEAESSEATTP